MLNLDQLDRLSQVKIEEVDKTTLVDIQTIRIDSTQPVTQRMESYLEQIGNPYLFICGDSVVKLRFEATGVDLADRLKNYYINLKKS